MYAPSNWRPKSDGSGNLIVRNPVTGEITTLTPDAFNALVKSKQSEVIVPSDVEADLNALGVVRSKVDPLTGGISFLVDGQGYAHGGIAPLSLTTEGISAAAGIALALGGGIVKLPPGDIVLTGSLPEYPGVIYDGAGWALDKYYKLVSGKGTRLIGDGSFPAFYRVAVAGGSTGRNTLGDLTAPQINNDAYVGNMAFNCGVRNVALDGFSYGIKSGAKYNGGAWGARYENIVAQNCTEWGFWFENFLDCNFRNLYPIKNANGLAFVASGNTIMLFGDSNATDLHPYGNTYRGLALAARSGSYLNDMHVYGLHAIGPLSPVNYTASLSSAAFTAQMSATASVSPNACTGYISNGAGNIGVYMEITSGSNIYPGMTISGSGISAATVVVSQLSGVQGGAGTYQVSIGQLVASAASPQTINVGGVLSGSGYAVDMALSTLSSTPGLSGVPSYILAGSGSTWYTSTPSTIASTTIYGSTPSISVPDLSQFQIGQPVCFTTTGNPNNYTTKAVYFVRTMSAATGSGNITLCANNFSQAVVGAPGSASFCAPHGSTGTTAAVIATTGFPVVEIANWGYGSFISSSSLSGAADIESGGTCRMLIQGIAEGSGSFEIGTVAANLNSYSSVAVRSCANLALINRYGNLVLDSDVTNIGLSGMAPTTIIGGNNCGVGFQQVPSTNAGQIFLSGYQVPEISYANSLTKFLGRAMSISSGRLASGALGTTSTAVTLSMTGNASFTLPLVAATNVGQIYELSNPTPFTATINTTSSQAIIGLGATGTSISMATLTSARLIASFDGTAYYWARMS